jgi:predicted RNA-binding Zn ribbon-like protein
MASRPVVRAPLAFVVEVINKWGAVPREVAGDHHMPYPSLQELGLEHDFPLDGLGDEAVVRVADALYPLFDAPGTTVLVERVNELLDRSAVRPSLAWEGDGDRIAEGWVADAPERLLAACALALRQHLLAWGDGHRLGLCEGVRCADVYVDSSSAGRRRFCSTICQNRTRVAAFRARRRDARTA